MPHASDGKMARQIKAGRQVKALIQQAGHTLSSVAPKIGYTREHLTRLLNSNKVDDLLIWKISNAIGVDLTSVSDLEKQSHESDDCEKEKARLRAELEEANRTIRDLSAALRALTEKN